MIDNTPLKQVDKFVYLGGRQFKGNKRRRCRQKNWPCLAAGASRPLTRIWTNKSIRRRSKIRIYEVFVTSSLLYNSETWTLNEKEKQRLRVFEMAVLRKIAGVTRKDRKRNDDIMTELGLTMDIIDRIQQKRLRYFGHVVRMKNYRLPKIALYGRVNGTRSRRRPRKRWMDNIREDCGRLNLDVNQADRLARDRDEWRRVLSWLPERATASQWH